MEKVNNDQLIGLMSLSEEISSLNQKMKQLVEQLHATSDGLANLQEIAGTLTSKVSQFKTKAGSYKPTTVTSGIPATPSYQGGVVKKGKGLERERIVPTPQNYKDYLPENQLPVTDVPLANEEKLPSVAELTNVKSTPVLDRETKKLRREPDKIVKQSSQRGQRTKKVEPKKKGFFGGKR
jgi:hypothetical protein